ncbi:Hypothetical predicted protein [Paramuricea clavata]|uniref:Uncharacterized protein n=1 Tax=Paramuricea clavata TaxID=317549 RepID=A0A6S7FWS5_PARCT|nr:Hypothetical predicted protein [Paramuricea clavata]
MPSEEAGFNPRIAYIVCRECFYNLYLTQARGGVHYQLQLKKKCFETWREYIKHLNYGSVRLHMAVQHQNRKLLSICWKYWTKFVVTKREKWRLVIRADLHYRQGMLRKLIGNWKLYCNNMREIKSFTEEKKTRYDKKTLRFLFDCWRENAQYLKTTRQNYHTSSQHWENKTMKKVFFVWRVYTEDRSWRKQQELFSVVEARKRLNQGKLHRTLHLWKKEYLLKISSKEKWTKATEHWKRCVLKNAFGVFKKYRFLGYRKQVLRQQCMLYHNERIIASHWGIWRSRYAERVTFLKKSHMALWMWSFTLQRKAFVSWFHYAEEKKKKKVAITKALERRQQWLHKVTVVQWIKFATYFIAERERFAATRHIQLSQNVQQSVQRCAVHWRRKTVRNRGKRRQVASQPLSVNTHMASHKAISTENKGNTAKTLPLNIVQNVSSVRRPRPRVPDYLRESFNLSELSEHITCSAADNEAVPRHLPPNFEPITQPKHLPEPTVYTSSITSRTSSNTSQTGLRETMPLESSSRNPQTFSKKVASGKKHVLLPPSSFVRTKKPVNNAQENNFSREGEKANKKQASKKLDGPSPQEIQYGSDKVNTGSCNDNPVSDAIPSFLSDKNSQQSIVQLRNRMLKYYTISTQLRELRRKLTCLRQWSRDSRENDETSSAEERSLVKEIVNELSENVESTSHNLEESYKTIANDLQQLLDKVS